MIKKKLFLYLVLIPIMIMLFTLKASFSKVIEGDIRVDMEWAEFIAAVEITNIEARKEDGIYTYVTYRPIEVLKGNPDTLPYTIRMMGGKVGDERLIVSDIPEFEVGMKYLLLLRFDNPYCPILGRYLRTFKIKHDPALNREKIFSYHDEKVYGFHDDGKVLTKQRSSMDEQIGVEHFRNYIRRISGVRNF